MSRKKVVILLGIITMNLIGNVLLSQTIANAEVIENSKNAILYGTSLVEPPKEPIVQPVGQIDKQSNVRGWKQKDGYWMYDAGETYTHYLYNKWEKIDGIWYYFNDKAYLECNTTKETGWVEYKIDHYNQLYTTKEYYKYLTTSHWKYKEGEQYIKNTWKQINGYWYYFDNQGYISTNSEIDGYYVDCNGVWRKEGNIKYDWNRVVDSEKKLKNSIQDSKTAIAVVLKVQSLSIAEEQAINERFARCNGM